MATFAILRDAINICRSARITPFIWGHRGLGKSSLVSQVCSNNNWGHVNMRLSQVEASDLRGLPDKVDGRTAYLPPADMPSGDMSFEQAQEMLNNEKDPNNLSMLAERLQPRISKGILFLDEINRAQDDVLQAVFELVLDRKVGQYVLPDGWCIVCAGNFNEGDYQTNGFMDAAFLDRFCHLTLDSGEQTLDEWVNYMSEKHDENAHEVIEFVTQDLKHLDGAVSGTNDWSIQPSRRSWESVVRVEEACKNGSFSQEARIEVIAGLIGRSIAIKYSNYRCPVSPRDIIEKGVAKNSKGIGNLTRNQLIGLIWGMVSYCKNKVDTSEKHANACIDLAEWMANSSQDKDLIAAFLRSLVTTGKGNDRARNVAVFNPKVADMLAKSGRKVKKNKDFIGRLHDRKDLHDLVSKVSWGLD